MSASGTQWQWSAYARTTEPEVEPIDPALFMRWARVDDEEERALFAMVTKAARQLCEKRIGRSLITQKWTGKLDCWPTCNEIGLPRGPVQAVESVIYLDEADATQTLATSVYEVDALSLRPRLALRAGQSWPTLSTRRQAITIVVRTGYGDRPEDVPETLRSWIALVAGTMFANREADAERAVQRHPFVDGLLDGETLIEIA